MPINNNPKVNSKIVFREEGDDALLFNPDTGQVKVLNEAGKITWSNLTGKNNQDFLVRKIMEAFDILDEQKVKEDLEKFILELEKLNFLEKDES